MPLPKNKKELLENLRVSYEKLDVEYDGIPRTKGRVKGIVGDVSACDVLAYQIGYLRLLLGWEEQEKKGKVPEMPAPGYQWNELGRLAQAFYRNRKDASLEELGHEFSELVSQVTNMINELGDKELFKPHQREWTGEKWAMVKWIQVNTIAPFSSARTKVRRRKKSTGLL